MEKISKREFLRTDTIALTGGVLHRTGTIAAGAEMCDFYVCKKGSEWDKEIRR
ncbi:MAG: hypothetical protein LIO99_14405 [Clostridiales bacterium]|nr:hypothetical protein [Clostridiales bacterium]